jgi:hypothetical protein
MHPETNGSLMSDTTVKRSTVLYHGFRLGAVASVIGSILFVILYFVCQIAHGGSLRSIIDLESGFLIFFLAIPCLGLAVMLIPGILGGGVIAFVSRRLSMSRNLPMFLGIMIGGLLGYVGAQIGNYYWGLHATIGPSCSVLSGVLAGAMAGVWYGNRIARWLTVV